MARRHGRDLTGFPSATSAARRAVALRKAA
jgi:hypothetical protein